MRTTRYVDLSARGAWPGPAERPQVLSCAQTPSAVPGVVLNHRHDEPLTFRVEIRPGASEGLPLLPRITCHACQVVLPGSARQER